MFSVNTEERSDEVRLGGIEPPSSVPKTDTLSVKLKALMYIIIERSEIKRLKYYLKIFWRNITRQNVLY